MADLGDRTTYLGMSESGAICGVSPWSTPIDVWYSKQTDMPTMPLTNNPIYWGRHLEGPIARAATDKFGFPMRKDNREYVHPEHGFIKGHIDRRISKTDIVEIKNVGLFMGDEWGAPETDDVPLYYLTQCLGYLGISNSQTCHLFVLIGGQDLRHYVIEFDQAAYDAIIARMVAFWNDHVLTGVPPEPTTAADIKKLYPTAQKGEILLGGATESRLLKERALLKEKQATLETKLNAMDVVLQHLMRTADTLMLDDKVAVTWKTHKSKRLDQKALKETEPKIYEQYLKASEYRRWLVK